MVIHMKDTYLKIVYEDYYNIKRTLDLTCDMDVIKFVYYLSQNHFDNEEISFDIQKFIEFAHPFEKRTTTNNNTINKSLFS